MSTAEPFWELPEDELPIDQDWREYLEHREEQKREQLERHGDITEQETDK